MKLNRGAIAGLLAPAIVLVTVMFVAPVIYFLKFSLDKPSTTAISVPAFSFENFVTFFSDPYAVGVLLRTAEIAGATVVLTGVFALPLAYAISKAGGRTRTVLMAGIVFPMLVGNVVRTIGWSTLFGYSGVINSVLMGLHIVSEPIQMLQTPWSVVVVIVSILLPVMILTLFASFVSTDVRLENASLDLGASRTMTFWRVILPQIVPGLIGGASIVFVLAMNSYVIPLLIGGLKVPVMGTEMYQQITQFNNWPLGAAMAVILLVTSLVLVTIFAALMRRQFERWRRPA
jgi:putative spermidine/putrescine transport system permease protein